MPRFSFRKEPGQARTAGRETRNAVSALGQTEAFATYVGTWLAGIAIGAILFGLIVGLGALSNNSRLNTAAAATSDRNGADQIGNQPVSQREAIAQEGYKIFSGAAGCVGCHQQGGYSTGGQGPRLIYSGNSRDSTYIHSIVRWGYSPMPAYPKPDQLTQQQKDNGVAALTDDELYKIVVYLQYIHDTPNQKPSWVK